MCDLRGHLRQKHPDKKELVRADPSMIREVQVQSPRGKDVDLDDSLGLSPAVQADLARYVGQGDILELAASISSVHPVTTTSDVLVSDGFVASSPLPIRKVVTATPVMTGMPMQSSTANTSSTDQSMLMRAVNVAAPPASTFTLGNVATPPASTYTPVNVTAPPARTYTLGNVAAPPARSCPQVDLTAPPATTSAEVYITTPPAGICSQVNVVTPPASTCTQVNMAPPSAKKTSTEVKDRVVLDTNLDPKIPYNPGTVTPKIPYKPGSITMETQTGISSVEAFPKSPKYLAPTRCDRGTEMGVPKANEMSHQMNTSAIATRKRPREDTCCHGIRLPVVEIQRTTVKEGSMMKRTVTETVHCTKCWKSEDSDSDDSDWGF